MNYLYVYALIIPAPHLSIFLSILSIPIFALTTHIDTLRKVTLYRGVYPAHLKTINTNHAQVNKDAINVLTNLGVAKDNDLVIITKGDLAGIQGGTNAMKIVKVGHLVES